MGQGPGFSPHGPTGAQPLNFDPRPATEQVKPLPKPQPPYLASQTGERTDSPVEPWGESLKTLMLVFGVLLVACFVAPWAVGEGQTVFSWTFIKNAPNAFGKLQPLLLAGTGVLAVVIGALPLAVGARGIAAALLGIAPVVYVSVGHGGAVSWQSLVVLLGALTLVPGLVLRSQYTGALLARILVTIGVICLLLPLLIPQGGALPIVGMFKMIGAAPGKTKILAILTVVPPVLAVLSLIAWLKAPSRAGAIIFAWIFISLPMVVSLAGWLLNPEIGASLKANLFGIFYLPIAAMGWAAFIGYGVATAVGKKLEHA